MHIIHKIIDLLPDTFVPDFPPRLIKLYNFIQQNHGLTDKEATIMYLGNEKRAKYFNLLKGELKKELLQCFIATRRAPANKSKALIEECYHLHTTCKILFLDNKSDIAVEIAKILVPKLQKLELHSLLHSVVSDLLIYYSAINGSTKNQRKYTLLTQQALRNIQEHAIVMHHYNNIVAMCNSRESYTTTIVEACIKAANQVTPLVLKDRHNTNRYIYIILIFRYTVIYDYAAVIKYCDEALNSFPKNHPNIRSLSFVFLFNKTSALIPLGKLEMAKKVARETQPTVPKGNLNWHLILLKRIVVCLHAADYQEAYQLYKAHVKKKCPYPLIKEYWSIIKGYLYFLIQVGLIEPYAKEHFYLGKFLNEMPIYSKDKAGNNINILIIQILVQMKRGEFIKIIDRIESLREYARLYTRNEETKRANTFIKMILKMESSSFHRTGAEAKVKALLKKLEETPLRMGQNLAVEIVPYPVLWTEMLYMMDNKFRGITKKKSINKQTKNR